VIWATVRQGLAPDYTGNLGCYRNYLTVILLSSYAFFLIASAIIMPKEYVLERQLKTVG
jgi:hypothetical protein